MRRFVFLLLLPAILALPGNATAAEHTTSERWAQVEQAVLSTFSTVAPARKTALFLDEKPHLARYLIRFEPRLDGLPIFFRRGAALVTEEGFVERIADPLRGAVPPATPPLFPDDAQVASWTASLEITVKNPAERGYWMDGDNRLRPCIRVETSPRSEDAQIWYLDAITGRSLFTEPLFQTAAASTNTDADSGVPDAIMGAVYLQNPRTTPDTTLVPIEFLDDDALHLYGAYARVETCIDTDECRETAPAAKRSDIAGRELVFEPETDIDAQDPFAEVNVYYNISSISDWIHNQFGWDMLFNEETWISVKVGRYWENAAYYSGSEKTPPYLIFGRTESVNFAYDADTAHHEFGHAINDLFWDHPWARTDALGLDTTMFALEESAADLWALTFGGDPILNGDPDYSRNAANSYTCPYNLIGEGHLDGRIVDGALWDLREEIGKDAFEHIFYRTLAFMGNEAGFDDLPRALEQALESLVDEGAPGIDIGMIDAVRNTARNRGLLSPDCRDRIVPFEDGQTRGVVGYGRPKTRKMDYPFGLQWKVTFPADAKSAVLYLSWLYPDTTDEGEPVEPGYRVHVRRGLPVEVLWLDDESTEQGEPAFTVVADHTFDGAPETVAYPFEGLSPPDEGEEMFFLLSAASDESTIVVQAALRLSNENALPPAESTDDSSLPSVAAPKAAVGGTSCSISISPAKQTGIFSAMMELIEPSLKISR